MEKEEWNEISKNYYKEILSPLKNSSSNPLFRDLKRIRDKEKRVIDLGCGLGELVPNLSELFREVTAIDFSEKMIQKAKESNKNIKNANFKVIDMLNLNSLNEQFDVAVSVNSIVLGDIKKINKIFEEIYNIIHPGGKFLCILPSMEVFAYQSLLIAEKEIEKTEDNNEITKKIKKEIPDKEHNFVMGLVDFEGIQKAYYRFEILWRLKKAGFRNIKIKKVFYSWEEFEKAGQLYFPDEDPPWDWYVICEK